MTTRLEKQVEMIESLIEDKKKQFERINELSNKLKD